MSYNLSLYFMSCCVNTVLVVINISFSSGKLGDEQSSPGPSPHEALSERTQDKWLHQTTSAWAMLWNICSGKSH